MRKCRGKNCRVRRRKRHSKRRGWKVNSNTLLMVGVIVVVWWLWMQGTMNLGLLGLVSVGWVI